MGVLFAQGAGITLDRAGNEGEHNAKILARYLLKKKMKL